MYATFVWQERAQTCATRDTCLKPLCCLPREASTLIFKIRSCAVRSDLENKAFWAEFCLFSRSDLTTQDRILKIRVLASLGVVSKSRLIASSARHLLLVAEKTRTPHSLRLQRSYFLRSDLVFRSDLIFTLAGKCKNKIGSYK